MKLYDKDESKHDDYLGFIQYDIADSPISNGIFSFDSRDEKKTPESLKFPVLQGESTFRPQGTISFAAFVDVVDTLIMVKNADHSTQTLAEQRAALKNSGIDDRSSLRRLDKVESAVEKLLSETHASDPVCFTLRDSKVLTDSTLYDKYMIQDLLYDIRNVSTHANIIRDICHNRFKGEYNNDLIIQLELDTLPMHFMCANGAANSAALLHPRSSTRLNMSELYGDGASSAMLLNGLNIKQSYSPVARSGLRLEFDRKTSANEVMMIHTSNVYSSWVLLRTIRQFLDAWHECKGCKDINYSAYPDDFRCFGVVELEGDDDHQSNGSQRKDKSTNTLSDPSNLKSGFCVLSMKNHFELLLLDPETRDKRMSISLDDLVYMGVDADAPLSSPYTVVVEVVSANPFGASEHESGDRLSCGDGGTDRWVPGKFVKKGTGMLLGTGIEIAKGFKHTAKGVVHTAKTIAKGDTGRLHADTEAAMSNVANTLNAGVDVVGALFDTAPPNHFYVVIKDISGGVITQYSADATFHGEAFSFAIDPKYFEDMNISHGHGLHVYLFQTPQKLLGEVFVSYNHIVPSLNRTLTHVATNQIRDGMCIESEFPLNVEVSYVVTLVEGINLSTGVPQSYLKQAPVREYFVKCRFVSWNGHKVDGGRYSAHRSKGVAKSNDGCPNFKNQEIVLTCDDGPFMAEYVRVEIFIVGGSAGLSSGSHRVGSVFIPLRDFEFKARTKPYRVVHFKDLNLKLARAGLGDLLLTISKRGDPSDGSATVKLKSSIHRSNIYSTYWSSHCLLSGSILQDRDVQESSANNCVAIPGTDQTLLDPTSKCYVEYYNIAPGYEGVVMVDSSGLDLCRIMDKEEENNFGIVGEIVSDTVNLGGKAVRKISKFTRLNARNVHDPNIKRAVTTIPEMQTSVYSIDDDKSSGSPSDVVVVSVYEYDKRSILPPYGWCADDAQDGPRKYADETGSLKAPFKHFSDSEPPSGYLWHSSSWKYDCDYTKTDSNGWSYGLTIGFIRSNLKENTPNPSPVGVTVRRRKWIRKAVRQISPTEAENSDFHSNSPEALDAFSQAERDSLSSAPAPFSSAENETAKESLPSRKILSSKLPPGAILPLCQERGNKPSTSNTILVPWGQVKSVSVVTASILSLKLTVHKYKGDNTKGEEAFTEVELEVFVWSCPAEELRSLIEERKGLYSIRHDMMDVLASGKLSSSVSKSNIGVRGAESVSGIESSVASLATPLIGKTTVVVSDHGNSKNAATEESDMVPETVELSLGASTIAQLDDLLEVMEENAMKTTRAIEHMPKPKPKRGISTETITSPEVVNKNSAKCDQANEVPFSKGKVLIRSLHCTNLKNVEVGAEIGLGKNDVYVELQMGKWRDKTPILDETGATAEFDRLDFVIGNVSARMLQHDFVSMRVCDYNRITKDVLIGKAEVPLGELFKHPDTLVFINVDIFGDDGKQSGHVVVCAEACRAAAPKTAVAVDRRENIEISAKSMLCENVVMWRRVARVRLYIASLLGVGLDGDHGFRSDEIRALIKKDLQIAHSIQHENDVDTASNRIQFLLDTAEMRIRNTALCGWAQREGEVFSSVIQSFLNSYFISMISLLGKFFESKGSGMKSMKGLTSKIKLINFFLKNDNSLSHVANRALGPYSMTTSPPPQFSLCLELDTLLQWYSTTLLEEMKSYVDKVFYVWTSDLNESKEFVYPLPWKPHHYERGQGGRTVDDYHYFTDIPQNCQMSLHEYLHGAKIKVEDLSPFYASRISKLNLLVQLSYAKSFEYCAELYSKALLSKDWTIGFGTAWDVSEDMEVPQVIADQLYEAMSFLSSVANDCAVVLRSNIIELQVEETLDSHSNQSSGDADTFNSQSNEVTQAVDRVLVEFGNVQRMAIVKLSGIAFAFVINSFVGGTGGDFEDKWILACEEHHSAADRDEISDINRLSPFYTGGKALRDEMEGYFNLLHFDCYIDFLGVCVDKVVVLLLYVLKMCDKKYALSFKVGGMYSKQIIKDIDFLMQCFEELCESVLLKIPENSKHYKDFMHDRVGMKKLCQQFIFDRFRRFAQAKVLLGSSDQSEIMEVLQDMVEESRADETSATTSVFGHSIYISYFLETLINLHGNKAKSGYILFKSENIKVMDMTPRASTARRRVSVFDKIFHREEAIQEVDESDSDSSNDSGFEGGADGDDMEDHYTTTTKVLIDNMVYMHEKALSEYTNDEDCSDEFQEVVGVIKLESQSWILLNNKFGLSNLAPLRRVFDRCSIVSLSNSISSTKATLQSGNRNSGEHHDRWATVESFPMIAHLIHSSTPMGQLLEMRKQLASDRKGVGHTVASGVNRMTKGVASGVAGVTMGTARGVVGAFRRVSHTFRSLASNHESADNFVNLAGCPDTSRVVGAESADVEAESGEDVEGDVVDNENEEEVEKNFSDMLALADAVETESKEISAQTEELEAAKVRAKADAVTKAQANVKPYSLGANGYSNKKCSMIEILLTDVRAVNLFPYSKSKIDTYLDVSVHNHEPCDCGGMSVDINRDPKKTNTVCDESDPIYDCRDMHFVIPAVLLSESKEHTKMTVVLMMNGNMSLFGGTAIGSVEVDLNALYTAKSCSSHTLELAFTWKNSSIEEACQKHLQKELKTLRSCPVPGTSADSVVPKFKCTLKFA